MFLRSGAVVLAELEDRHAADIGFLDRGDTDRSEEEAGADHVVDGPAAGAALGDPGLALAGCLAGEFQHAFQPLLAPLVLALGLIEDDRQRVRADLLAQAGFGGRSLHVDRGVPDDGRDDVRDGPALPGS